MTLEVVSIEISQFFCKYYLMVGLDLEKMVEKSILMCIQLIITHAYIQTKTKYTVFFFYTYTINATNQNYHNLAIIDMYSLL